MSASFVVIETVRAKYACPHCHDGVVEASAPPQAVEKSLAGEGLLAHVVVSKYVDHLPLHRLERIFARQAIDLSRTTLCGWMADVATALTPISGSKSFSTPRPPTNATARRRSRRCFGAPCKRMRRRGTTPSIRAGLSWSLAAGRTRVGASSKRS